jgi:hypothetical protein
MKTATRSIVYTPRVLPIILTCVAYACDQMRMDPQ